MVTEIIRIVDNKVYRTWSPDRSNSPNPRNSWPRFYPAHWSIQPMNHSGWNPLAAMPHPIYSYGMEGQPNGRDGGCGVVASWWLYHGDRIDPSPPALQQVCDSSWHHAMEDDHLFASEIRWPQLWSRVSMLMINSVLFHFFIFMIDSCIL